MRNKVVFIAVVVVFFILALVIYGYTPMHSDDFWYAVQGFDTDLKHYKGWSGRMLSDFISPLILIWRSSIVTMVAGALGLTGLFFFITVIPLAQNKKGIFQKGIYAAFSYALLAMLYWLLHPELGQSTFWTVGSANYMWTNFFIGAYFYFLLRYYYQGKLNYGIFPLALLAGCTNENTAPLVVGFTFFISFLAYYQSGKIDVKFIIVSLLNLMGAIVLLLSPGNPKRLAVTNSEWEEVPQKIKITNHLNAFLGNYWDNLSVIFIGVVVLLAICYIFSEVKIFKNKKLTVFAFSVFFLVVSLVSDFAMSQAPVYPKRAMSGPFFFLLLSLSFAIAECSKISLFFSRFKKLNVLFISILGIVFLFFYFSKMLPLYQNINKQYRIQLGIIEKCRNIDKDTLEVPRIVFNAKYAERIIIDRWESPKKMREYFELSKPIKFIDLPIDFSQINTRNQIKNNLDMYTSNGIENIYSYEAEGGSVFILEFSSQEIEKLPSNYLMFFHVYLTNNEFGNYDIGKISPFYHNNKAYVKIVVKDEIGEIKKINFGYFDERDFNVRFKDLILEIN